MFSTTNILAFLLASNVLLVDEEVWAFSSIKKVPTRLQIATKKEIITTKDELGTAVYDVNDKHAVIG